MNEFDDLDSLAGGGTSPLSESPVDSRFSIGHMKANYLFGIDLVDREGNEFPASLLWHHLNSAIQFTERLLDVVITPTKIEERHDFYSTDFANWGYLNLYKKPTIKVNKLVMMYGNQQMLEIPQDWLQITKLSSMVQMFPTSGSAGGLIIGASGSIMGMQSQWDSAPQLWRVTYTAGFETIPFELYDFIYKRACINVLGIWGDLVLGAGIANQAISIDGLSQSVGTTKSTTYNAASARCQQYRDDLAEMLPVLKSKYDGIRMVSL